MQSGLPLLRLCISPQFHGSLPLLSNTVHSDMASPSLPICVCVYVCVREEGMERKGGGENKLWSSMSIIN